MARLWSDNLSAGLRVLVFGFNELVFFMGSLSENPKTSDQNNNHYPNGWTVENPLFYMAHKRDTTLWL